ncbi:hypothetical protein A4A49_16378 [Nicotiana attenuata]|uniref:Uncharacterized protein n=1 Tax=Nicotiana attenuata TaxID=49451 RepID=A0A314L5X7_NICAT|nr:hypothetical protein A4A49_16378 [Nicotiana attenuata]
MVRFCQQLPHRYQKRELGYPHYDRKYRKSINKKITRLVKNKIKKKITQFSGIIDTQTNSKKEKACNPVC